MRAWEASPDDLPGMTLRLMTLSTHYTKVLNFKADEMARARKTLLKWYRLAEPNADGPPISVLKALSDNLNTPLAITEMHRLSKSDPRALFAGLRALGLIPGEGLTIDYGTADFEVHTTPDDRGPENIMEIT